MGEKKCSLLTPLPLFLILPNITANIHPNNTILLLPHCFSLSYCSHEHLLLLIITKQKQRSFASLEVLSILPPKTPVCFLFRRKKGLFISSHTLPKLSFSILFLSLSNLTCFSANPLEIPHWTNSTKEQKTECGQYLTKSF